VTIPEPLRPWLRGSMAKIATDERCSVSIADLWQKHTVLDVILYLEGLDFSDELRRPAE